LAFRRLQGSPLTLPSMQGTQAAPRGSEDGLSHNGALQDTVKEAKQAWEVVQHRKQQYGRCGCGTRREC
jgi:hypothetical protein